MVNQCLSQTDDECITKQRNAEGKQGSKLHCTFILLALHVLHPIEGFPQYTISNIYRRLGCFWVESCRFYVLDGPMWTGWNWSNWTIEKLNWVGYLSYVVSGRQYMDIEWPGNALRYMHEGV